jgi:hypothetical protein
MGDFDYSGKRSGTGSKPYSVYASSNVTVSGSATDYSLSSNTTLFDKITSPVELLLRNGSVAINIKFNSTSNDTVALAADSDFGVQNLIITDVYITTTDEASFDIFMMGWK